MPTSKLEKERKLLHYANVGKQIKEGRHVGLDFYDLLIEALIEGFECNGDISPTERHQLFLNSRLFDGNKL